MENNVKLIAATQGAGELINKNAEEITSYVARVSNPNNQLNFETGAKLLAYCIRHAHWSPFEHAYFTLEIKTSRAIAAQILRHRSFVFQEFSQRYALANTYVNYPARRQDTKNRQNSIDDMSDQDKEWFANEQESIWNTAKKTYDEAISRGIAKEQARFLLPLNTQTTMYMTGSIRSWLTYFLVRMEKSTQREHREIAVGAYQILKPLLPDVASALEELYPHLFT